MLLPPNLRLDKLKMDYKKLYEEQVAENKELLKKFEELKKDHTQLIKQSHLDDLKAETKIDELQQIIDSQNEEDGKPPSPTNELCGMIFDIKDQLSDGQYKNIMDKLQTENEKSVLPKYVKLYHISGYNNIYQHTTCMEYKTSMMEVNYTWDTADAKDDDDDIELKRLDVSMVMTVNEVIYEIVPFDDLDGYYISSKYSKIRVNSDGKLMSDIKVGSIINECPHVWKDTRAIFIIKELIY